MKATKTSAIQKGKYALLRPKRNKFIFVTQISKALGIDKGWTENGRVLFGPFVGAVVMVRPFSGPFRVFVWTGRVPRPFEFYKETTIAAGFGGYLPLQPAVRTPVAGVTTSFSRPTPVLLLSFPASLTQSGWTMHTTLPTDPSHSAAYILHQVAMPEIFTQSCQNSGKYRQKY